VGSPRRATADDADWNGVGFTRNVIEFVDIHVA
jgi:hypothetical protein